MNPSVWDKAGDGHHTRVDEELLETTQEAESSMMLEDSKVLNQDFRQLPEDGDSVALHVYIEGLLQELETDEQFKFSSEDFNFDVDEALVDTKTFLEKRSSVVVPNSAAVVNHFPAEEKFERDNRTLVDDQGKPKKVNQKGKCVFSE